MLNIVNTERKMYKYPHESSLLVMLNIVNTELFECIESIVNSLLVMLNIVVIKIGVLS